MNHLGRIEKAPEVSGSGSELCEGGVNFLPMAQVCHQHRSFRGIRPEVKLSGGPSDQFVPRIAELPLECFVHLDKPSILERCHREGDRGKAKNLLKTLCRGPAVRFRLV